MKAIYKYNLEVQDAQVVALPKDAKILCVQAQNNEPQLWAEVDTENPKEKRGILIVGTGHPMENVTNNRRYISTFQLHNGALVFHAYEIL